MMKVSDTDIMIDLLEEVVRILQKLEKLVDAESQIDMWDASNTETEDEPEGV
jgi:hypothetical protein